MAELDIRPTHPATEDEQTWRRWVGLRVSDAEHVSAEPAVLGDARRAATRMRRAAQAPLQRPRERDQLDPQVPPLFG